MRVFYLVHEQRTGHRLVLLNPTYLKVPITEQFLNFMKPSTRISLQVSANESTFHEEFSFTDSSDDGKVVLVDSSGNEWLPVYTPLTCQQDS